MRFRAPRSISPSPIRRTTRRRSTFGLQSDSDDSEYGSEYSDSDSSDAESILSSSSSDSFCYASESEVPRLPPKAAVSVRDLAEQRKIEDTVAAIRLRTRHHDPYEDWERQTRMDAFRTARKELNAMQTRFHNEQDHGRTQEMQRRAALHAQQMKEIEARLEALRTNQRAEDEKLRVSMQERQKVIWEGIEGVIKVEEDKVKARLEEERKRMEEQERKRKQEEEQQKVQEEKRKEEQRKKDEEAEKAAAEKEKREKEEAETQRLQAEQDLQNAEREKGERTARDEFGMTKPEEDWKAAHTHLQEMKTQTMKSVKADKGGKSEWSKWRRQIIPKIGQITDDEKEINRISLQIYQIMHPPNTPPHHPAIYKALLSSLSKAILLQAETEVTAEKKSAPPLAKVTFNLLETLEGFAETFFAKLVQRSGGWPLPYMVPGEDIGPGPWKSDDERMRAMDRARKTAMGFRKSSDSDDLETTSEYTARVSGIMRVYFCILKFPPQQKPLHPLFRLPRYWMWFSRLLKDRKLLETSIAPQLIYTALDVLGSHARRVWGHQWNKLLELVYEGVTIGYGNGKIIGGTSGEGIAARVRVQLEVERILLGPEQ
ncbi:GLE1-like protein-domain-containing protein [Lyophyllum atratum]|nr:GLE1-like protein-domain-containing protein [Lyophyllum atratum]